MAPSIEVLVILTVMGVTFSMRVESEFRSFTSDLFSLSTRSVDQTPTTRETTRMHTAKVILFIS